jgi:hypothetical protein
MTLGKRAEGGCLRVVARCDEDRMPMRDGGGASSGGGRGGGDRVLNSYFVPCVPNSGVHIYVWQLRSSTICDGNQ